MTWARRLAAGRPGKENLPAYLAAQRIQPQGCACGRAPAGMGVYLGRNEASCGEGRGWGCTPSRHTPNSDCWWTGLMTGRLGSTSPSASCGQAARGTTISTGPHQPPSMPAQLRSATQGNPKAAAPPLTSGPWPASPPSLPILPALPAAPCAVSTSRPVLALHPMQHRPFLMPLPAVAPPHHPYQTLNKNTPPPPPPYAHTPSTPTTAPPPHPPPTHHHHHTHTFSSTYTLVSSDSSNGCRPKRASTSARTSLLKALRSEPAAAARAAGRVCASACVCVSVW